ncbi:phosphatidylinositol synthase 1 (CDP-alcohol phosphatidyltransferase1) [Lodderomyces elongisporus]|uniref:phosphatidylinositol synthase 1 (CDP-alcohol phosphatidyltransferase1) n=1 Tax=Lodderomyces elongisporus TaxID=36914 RepID=UPI0029274BF9|nr:phosphatidylinositol synthase 1 (CDP-alcohol phosphatidyltransferase1) [Lodderomyces elongisporus]WLF80660.1 phosphatidylinositol synthase 1 (CDP-alcohol phosphatidyltransferase1) [Lodderomyces elongisporus]
MGTRFGAVLDMVTDRCATSSLIVYLAIIYPRFTVIWQLLVSLDLASHYIHMYGMLSAGSSSHKNVEASQSKLLNLYYTNRKVLFAVCALNELFYVAIYLKYYGFFWLGTVMAVLSTPIWVFKQIANVIQLQSASLILARMDVEEHKNKKR